MSRNALRGAFLLVAPLVFAAIMWQHPREGDTAYEAVSNHTNEWLAVHIAGAVFFPLMGLVIWLTVRDLDGRAARLSRFALILYVALYGIFKSVVGIGSGILVKDRGLTAAQGPDVVDALFESPIAQVFWAVGAVSFMVAVGAAIVALRKLDVPRSGLFLLGLGMLQALHIPPVDVATLGALGIGGYLVHRSGAVAEGRSRRAGRAMPVPAPA